MSGVFNMTKQNVKDLIEIRKSENYTQSDIECYCDEHGIGYDAAFEMLEIMRTLPDCCVGCKHSTFYSKLSTMYPCNQCARIMKDMYESE